jgi:hypothetical protein
MSYAKVRKLAKNYYKLERLLYFYEDILNKKTFFINKDKLNKDYKKFCKTIRYMNIYKAVFSKSLKELSKEDAFIVREIYTKGKSVCNVAFKNYISDSTVYRILKKFNFIFFNNMKKVSRIVDILYKEIKEN